MSTSNSQLHVFRQWEPREVAQEDLPEPWTPGMQDFVGICVHASCIRGGGGHVGCVQAHPGPSQASRSPQPQGRRAAPQKLGLVGGKDLLSEPLPCSEMTLEEGDHPRLRSYMSSIAIQGTGAPCKPECSPHPESMENNLADDHPKVTLVTTMLGVMHKCCPSKGCNSVQEGALFR